MNDSDTDLWVKRVECLKPNFFNPKAPTIGLDIRSRHLGGKNEHRVIEGDVATKIYDLLMANGYPASLIEKVNSMKFWFPAEVSGHGVDPSTGQGTPPEERLDEEAVEIAVEILDEPSVQVLRGAAARNFYVLVRHSLKAGDASS